MPGLREMLRVTRPGGRLVVCEFSHPTWAPFRTVYIEYLMKALPAVARAVSSSPDAYVYLAESIRAWPDQPASPRWSRRPAGGRPSGEPDRRDRRPAPRDQVAPAPPTGAPPPAPRTGTTPRGPRGAGGGGEWHTVWRAT